MYALLRGIVEKLPTPELRVMGPRLNFEGRIMRAMHRHGSITVRKLKHSSGCESPFVVPEWEQEFQALCDAGKLRVEEHTGKYRPFRMVILLKD